MPKALTHLNPHWLLRIPQTFPDHHQNQWVAGPPLVVLIMIAGCALGKPSGNFEDQVLCHSSSRECIHGMLYGHTVRSKLERETEVARTWSSAFIRVLILQSRFPKHESASLYRSGKLSSTFCYDRDIFAP